MTLGFSPVPKAADTGETYGVAKPPVASGPYMIQSYKTGNGGKMILVRNPKWSQASDPYRTAYPDQWEVDFGIDPKVIDQRLIQSSGNDQTAISYAGMQPENLAIVFTDPKTPLPGSPGRAVSDFDPYTRYLVDQRPEGPEPARSARPWRSRSTESALRKNAGWRLRR